MPFSRKIPSEQPSEQSTDQWELNKLPQINSLQNPKIKRLVRLRSRREREKERIILSEGARESLRALEAGVKLHELYLCPELFSPDAHHVLTALTALTTLTALTRPTQPITSDAPHTNHTNAAFNTTTLLSRTAFEKVSRRENPDGVLAIFEPPHIELSDIASSDTSQKTQTLVLVLHGLEKPGNIGAILRTADAVGVAAVLVLGRGADPYSPHVIRASQGSVFHVPTLVMSETEALTWLDAQQFSRVACTPDAKQHYWDAPLTGKIALLLGTEHSGLPQTWRDTQLAVAIPMQGAADSLNVSTAAALVMYECLRQQNNN